MTMINKVYNPNQASACFFRSSVYPPNYKVLLQITERCNFKCAHCFVNSTNSGNEMSIRHIRDKVIPNLVKSNVIKVTLTGGEPLVHKDIIDIITALCDYNIAVSICTNGSLISESLLNAISEYDNIHFNISMDGLEYESHGRFRGDLDRFTFDKVIENAKLLGHLNLLNGILTTPNKFAEIDEYDRLCDFARNIGAKYILMNPLSPFGRGCLTQPLAYSSEDMIMLRNQTRRYNTPDFEVVFIRFPNDELPLSGCPLGSFPYIFTNGDVVICPYLAFASETDDSGYSPKDFVLYNVITDDLTISESIKSYTFPNGARIDLKGLEGKGCCANKIAQHQPLDGFDYLF